MRYFGAIRGTGRFASEDIEYRDILFPKGTMIMPSMAAANHDPEAFESPGTFDITRDPPDRPQLTFGSGIHYCLGAALARAELQEALPILARRMPDLALDGDVTWKPISVGIFGPEHLPVTFTRELTLAPRPDRSGLRHSFRLRKDQPAQNGLAVASISRRGAVACAATWFRRAASSTGSGGRPSPWSGASGAGDGRRATPHAAARPDAPRRSSGSGAGCARRRRRS